MTRPGLSVLVLSSNDRSALALCRALGRSGHRISILRLAPEKSIADYSRYCAESLFIGVPGAAVSRFHEKLIQLVVSKRFDWLVPVGLCAGDIAYFDFDATARLTRIFGPTPAARGRARNLVEARNVASMLGLDCTDGLVVKQGDSVGIELSLPRRFRPVVPSRLIENEWQRFSERIVRSPSELEAKLRDDLPRVDVLLEEVRVGGRIGLWGLAREGSLLETAIFPRQHSRLSFARGQTSPLRPQLHNLMQAAVQELSWTGALSMTLRLEKDRMIFEKFDSDDDALLPGALSRMAGSTPEGLFASATATLPAMETLFDPVPELRKFSVLLSKMRRNCEKPLMPLLRAFHPPSKPPPALRKAARLLIVCQGNINRSVVAEYLFRARGCLHVASAALLPVSGRRASAQAEAFLAEHCRVDISAFRSQSIDRALEASAHPDLILSFEHWQTKQLALRFSELADRVYLITDLIFDGKGGRDIADPHGGSDENYRRCFSEIANLVARVKVVDASAGDELAL